MPRKAPKTMGTNSGCYYVKGISRRYWDDDYAERSTRERLKADDRRLLDEYFEDDRPPNDSQLTTSPASAPAA